MFLGEHQRALDDKGRVVLPSKFRAFVEEGCVITKGQERCLIVFTLDLWQEEVEKVSKLPRTNSRVRNYARAFFSSADRQSPDKQGRVHLNEGLRSYASLEKDVTIVGLSDRMEIWSTEAWDRMSQEVDAAYAAMEEELSDSGI